MNEYEHEPDPELLAGRINTVTPAEVAKDAVDLVVAACDNVAGLNWLNQLNMERPCEMNSTAVVLWVWADQVAQMLKGREPTADEVKPGSPLERALTAVRSFHDRQNAVTAAITEPGIIASPPIRLVH